MKNLATIDKESLKHRIAEVLSEILSDKHDCKVTLRFVPRDQQGDEEDERNERITA